jgi:hypothetical protein
MLKAEAKKREQKLLLANDCHARVLSGGWPLLQTHGPKAFSLQVWYYLFL